MLKKQWFTIIGERILVPLLLLVAPVQLLGSDELNIKLDKTEVKWGEVFTLEIEARNPLNRTVQGGITVSFSSNLIVTDKDRQSKIYYENSKVFKKGHVCCAITKDIMVENWYKRWPAHTKKKMRLKLFVVKTGTLKIYARAAFLKSIRKKQVINFPEYSSVFDQSVIPNFFRYIILRKTKFYP